MTFLVIAASVALLLVVAVAIAWPLLRTNDPDDDTVEQLSVTASAAVDPLLQLYERRDAIYQAISELRFDHQVGKVSDADYEAFDGQFKQQAVAVLREIDALQAAEADGEMDAMLEAEIAALRRNGHAGDPTGAKFCPQCGAAVGGQDRFCGRCGFTLAG